MPCEDHATRKKGDCKSVNCLQCRLCPPGRRCQLPGSHIRSVISGNLKRKNRGDAVFERPVPLTRVTQVRGVGRINMVEVNSDNEDSVNCWYLSDDEEFQSGEDDDITWDDNEYSDEEVYPENGVKHKLQAVFKLLKIPNEEVILDQISSLGNHNLLKGNHVQQRIFRIVHMVNTALFDLLCIPQDASKVKDRFFIDACNPTTNRVVSKHDKLVENLLTLGFHGTQSTSIIAQSALATTFSKRMCAILYRRSIASNPERDELPPMKKLIGRKKITSLRKVFRVLKNGKPIPKYNYTFRVAPAKLTSAVHYIESTLQVKPGLSRNIKLGGHLFRNLPIYDRGGQATKDLYAAYKRSFDDTLGLPTFRDLVKLLTKRGETKAGLSTYYIRFRYVGRVFECMLGRLAEMPYTSSDVALSMKSKLSNLLSKWKEMYLFLSYEYSFKHLQLNSVDKAHCATYAMGGICQHQHRDVVCQKCNSCFKFFTEDVMAVFNECHMALEMDADNRNEIGTMVSSLVYLQDVVKWYMGHRLRATVQFDGIAKIKASLKESNDRVLVVMDHKQKVLPMKFHEGQVEYFGKKGMSLLGFMIVSNYSEGDESDSGYQYEFIDVVVEGYSGQDHVQVASIIAHVLDIIKMKHPGVNLVFMQSDNASCFSSQEHIPYIHHNNKDWAKNLAIAIALWIFSEPGTGKGRLDTHFSFVNIKFRSYIEDDHDITTEEDIFIALGYRGGMAGTTVVLLNASTLDGKILDKKFKAKTGSRSSFEVRWGNDEVNIFEASNISTPECVPRQKLDKHIPLVLPSFVKKIFVSEKPPLRVKHNPSQKLSHSTPQAISSKHELFTEAFSHLHSDSSSESSSVFSVAASNVSPMLINKWAGYPGNSKGQMPRCCIIKLKQLYQQGKVCKSRKVSADYAHKILMADVIPHDWYAQCVVTVAKIKAFFSLTPKKMTQLLESDGYTYEMELAHSMAEISLLAEEEENAAEEPEEEEYAAEEPEEEEDAIMTRKEEDATEEPEIDREDVNMMNS